MTRAAILIAAASLAGCAHDRPRAPPEPKVVVQRVEVPVPVSCVPANLAPAPAFADTPQALRAAPDMAERDRLVKGEWDHKRVRLEELEAIVQGCRLIGAQNSTQHLER